MNNIKDFFDYEINNKIKCEYTLHIKRTDQPNEIIYRKGQIVTLGARDLFTVTENCFTNDFGKAELKLKQKILTENEKRFVAAGRQLGRRATLENNNV